MSRTKFKLTDYKDNFAELVDNTDHRTLAVWAIDCAERVLPYFEESFPEDLRPRNAIKTLRDWLESGVFKMAVIRGASLSAHAAAREVGQDNAARSAARAAGQCVATAHVPSHAMGAALYGLQTIHRATKADATAVDRELEWQTQRLLELRESRAL